MAYHGVAECFGRKDKWFTGVVVTNGAGSPRSGIYGDFTDEEMQQVRVLEQRKAAYVGEYACQIQLAFTSAEVKNPKETAVVEDLAKILLAANPEYVYLHNPADKHDTHVGVTMRTIAALRAVRDRVKPKKVYGCEVWRDLDWMLDEDKQVLPRQRPLQHRRRAGRRLRFAGQRRQALRPRHRRPPPGARHLSRLARHRPGDRAQLRHGPDAAGRRPVALRRGLCSVPGRSFSRGRGPPREARGCCLKALRDGPYGTVAT